MACCRTSSDRWPRRHCGAAGCSQGLAWLAQRVGGWGRVYVVEALCEVDAVESRPWLLRHACDGDYLNGYFAGRVAIVAHLNEAIVAGEVDDELVDHTGELLQTMAECYGMGMTLENYPPAPIVLAAHAEHLGRQEPAVHRYVTAAHIVHYLAKQRPEQVGCTSSQRDDVLSRYRAVLNRQNWCEVLPGLTSHEEPR